MPILTDTTQESPESVIPDGWELLPGGRAALWLDGHPYRVKAPKLGELKEITQLVRETSDTNAEYARKVQVEVDDINGGPSSDEDKRDQTRDLIRGMNETFQGAWWDLLSQVCALLGCHLPAVDDLPAWVIYDANNQLSALISHFQTAPPPRGGRGK